MRLYLLSAVVLILGCGPNKSSTPVASFGSDCQGVACFDPDETSSFHAPDQFDVIQSSTECTWFCASYNSAPASFVKVTFVYSNGCWVAQPIETHACP